MNDNSIENFDIAITAKRGVFDFNFKQVWEYRDLIWLLIKRDFVIAYKQSILGPLWYVIQPLLTTIIYSFVFGKMAKIGTDGIPYVLFYFSGTMLWTYFSNCLNSSSSCFINNKHIFDKVYFPRLCVPISTTVGHLFRLLIQFGCLLIFYFYHLFKDSAIQPSWLVVLFPLLLLWIGLMGMGIGIIASSLTTKYRDLKFLIQFALPLAMYATPIVYPFAKIPDSYKWLFCINPMTAPVEYFRLWFYGTGGVPLNMTVISIIETIVILFIGIILFNFNEKNFVDVV